MIAQGLCANTRQTWAKCGASSSRSLLFVQARCASELSPVRGAKPKSITCSLFMTVIRLWRKPCYPHSEGLCGPLTKKKKKDILSSSWEPFRRHTATYTFKSFLFLGHHWMCLSLIHPVDSSMFCVWAEKIRHVCRHILVWAPHCFKFLAAN